MQENYRHFERAIEDHILYLLWGKPVVGVRLRHIDRKLWRGGSRG